MATYDTSTGLRALQGGSLVNEIDTGFLALAQDVVALVAAAVAAATPVGSLHATAAAAAPSGFLICDGAAVSRSTFAPLFTAIGTTYGVGNGSTTFNVPDLRGRVPVGVDGAAARLAANDALGNSGGEEAHVLTLPESPAHAHGTGDATYTRFPTFKAIGGSGSPIYIPSTSTSSGYEYSLKAATDSQGGGGAHNNMQPFQVVNWMIKT